MRHRPERLTSAPARYASFASVCAALITLAAPLALADAEARRDARPDGETSTTLTPVGHLIVVIGENVSFDTLFGTYVPPVGASVRNLLSQGIVKADGSPGPRYGRTVQYELRNPAGRYSVDPARVTPYARLPQPSLVGAYDPLSRHEYGPQPDPRFARLSTNGPFEITRFVRYSDPSGFGTGDPVHRFFQMWQQTGGTNLDLHGYAWVGLTTGRGGDTPGVTAAHPGQGAELMGFFNMARGDAPYFRELAERYALSDNYHQAIHGGTGANFFAIATGDLPVYNVGGVLAVPPASQIEDPNPAPGTANFYRRDGYAGGSYVQCADPRQPGVDAVLDVLRRRGVDADCAPGAYYLVNNYAPPFGVAGDPRPLGPKLSTYPPQTVPTIGEALSAKGVSWRWYTGGREDADVTGDAEYAAKLREAQSEAAPGTPASAIEARAIERTRPLVYNDIGDPLNASTALATGPLRDHLRGLTSFYADLAGGTLPAVAWVVPKNLESGHPGYSVPARYEEFVRDLIDRVQREPALWRSTAILVTTDEGGGYFDSGEIQPLDFFGDGPRIPFIVVSPFARAGHVDHVYNDHASVLKFIERNWRLPALSPRSRDRLPDPVMRRGAYLPANGPAIGDLTSLFDFGSAHP